jgi:hypothetical protein
VGSFSVVMSDVFSQDSLEVTFPEDEDVVQALLSNGPYEALGEGTGVGRPYRRAGYAHALVSMPVEYGPLSAEVKRTPLR